MKQLLRPKNNDLYVALWQKTQMGDRAAFTQLCEAHYRLLFNYAANFIDDREMIKDAIQDLFLQLWEKRTTLGNINTMSIYLIRAIRNNLLYQMRKNKWYEFNHELDVENMNYSDGITLEDEWISDTLLTK